MPGCFHLFIGCLILFRSSSCVPPGLVGPQLIAAEWTRLESALCPRLCWAALWESKSHNGDRHGSQKSLLPSHHAEQAGSSHGAPGTGDCLGCCHCLKAVWGRGGGTHTATRPMFFSMALLQLASPHPTTWEQFYSVRADGDHFVFLKPQKPKTFSLLSLSVRSFFKLLGF